MHWNNIAVRINVLQLHATIWVNPTNNILNIGSQTQRITCYIHFHKVQDQAEIIYALPLGVEDGLLGQ